MGWLWLAAGFFDGFFDFANLSIFPGVILIFIARVLRSQAERTDLPELGTASPTEQSTMSEPETGRGETLDTEDLSKPQPPVIETPPEPQPEPELEPESELIRRDTDLFERILGSGSDDSDGIPRSRRSAREDSAGEGTTKPMSSEEMIARAHKRWDSKRR